MTVNPKPDYHLKLLQALRQADPTQRPRIAKWVSEHTDEQIINFLFKNSSEDSLEIRSGMLSRSGCEMLKTLFDFWQIAIKKPLTVKQRLRFARACKLPYYVTDSRIVCFESEIGVLLVLIQDDLSNLDDVLP